MGLVFYTESFFCFQLLFIKEINSSSTNTHKQSEPPLTHCLCLFVSNWVFIMKTLMECLPLLTNTITLHTITQPDAAISTMTDFLALYPKLNSLKRNSKITI